MRPVLITLALVLSVPMLGAGQIPSRPQETFSARAEARPTAGIVPSVLTIHLERYTNDHERQAVVTMWETGGSAGLTAALRNTPATGYVEIGVTRWAIRYARQEPTSAGRQIVVALDQPMFFQGCGRLSSQPRKGPEVGFIRFVVDASGTGQGTMAIAAQLRADLMAGLEPTEYLGEPIALVSVTKIG